MGLGTQAGAEVTDFLIVLNTRAALVRPVHVFLPIEADISLPSENFHVHGLLYPRR
jgi:lipid-binding SYLF domain-containing protein